VISIQKEAAMYKLKYPCIFLEGLKKIARNLRIASLFAVYDAVAATLDLQ
jgi:hypothetical protein